MESITAGVHIISLDLTVIKDISLVISFLLLCIQLALNNPPENKQVLVNHHQLFSGLKTSRNEAPCTKNCCVAKRCSDKVKLRLIAHLDNHIVVAVICLRLLKYCCFVHLHHNAG